MCGILGQINFCKKSIPVPSLRKIDHRGPDGRGEWTNDSGDVYLGHTRLAILEPTPAGKQPMNDKAQQFTITFNGEIYNHQTLRSLLTGIKWHGTSDTETLVELFACKGLGSLSLLKGMFAFAVHNNADNSVLLVRDRMGIKPLWFRQTSEAFSFSSEVRALLTSDNASFNSDALSEYIGFGRMPACGEIIDGITSVPAGCWMKIFSNGAIEKGSWWPQNKFSIKKLNNRIECLQRVNTLVTKAVEEHLISDVGVGAFLSGGIDSSIVTMVAGRALGQRLRTFTVGFSQEAFDERKIARLVAAKAGSEHIELEVSEEDCLNWVKEAVLNLDLPSVDAINTFIVSKAVTNTGLKVALSGLGGDELFGGYPSFKSVPLLKWLERLPANVSRGIINRMPKAMQEKLAGLRTFSIDELTVARRRFTSVPCLNRIGLTSSIPKIPLPPTGLDTMGKISWAEIQGYMIPMLLRDSDQMSMAVGLEIRVPFLDHQLVEKALSIEEKYKKGPGVKPLLVEAFRNDLPLEVYNRPKQGFSLPMNDWIKGPLGYFLDEGLNIVANVLKTEEPLRLKTVYNKGRLHWTRLWYWSVLGHWLSQREAGFSEQNTPDYVVAEVNQ